MAQLGQLGKEHRAERLFPLLDHLASENLDGKSAWEGWQLERITGGYNSLLYRATRDSDDMAVKFTIRDARDRAGREYGALSVLQQSGLCIAPTPILLERTRYRQPVVVQSWVKGETCAAPPAGRGEWKLLLQHLVTVHSVTPRITMRQLPGAVAAPTTARAAVERVKRELAQIPEQARSHELRACFESRVL